MAHAKAISKLNKYRNGKEECWSAGCNKPATVMLVSKNCPDDEYPICCCYCEDCVMTFVEYDTNSFYVRRRAPGVES